MAKVKLSAFDRLRLGARLNRKERRDVEQRLSATDPGLEIVNRDAAGIDVGNESHYVAVPRGRDAQPVREFGSWTAALVEMAQWLMGCGIRTVVMQSTGVYWIAVHDVLQKHGLEVNLVDARGTKNVPGRKSDVQECQWLMRLHTYGIAILFSACSGDPRYTDHVAVAGSARQRRRTMHPAYAKVPNRHERAVAQCLKRYQR